MELRQVDYHNETDCYNEMVRLLHKDGLACPRCKARERLRKHRRHRKPLDDLRCSQCGGVFNARTGTPLEKCHLRPSQVVRIVHAIVFRQPSASLARQLGCSRSTVLRWRRQLQAVFASYLEEWRQSPPANLAG